MSRKVQPIQQNRVGTMKALVINNPGTGSGGFGDNSIARIYRGSRYDFKAVNKRLDEIYPSDLILQQLISVPVNDALSQWRESSTSLAKEEQRLTVKRVVMEAGIAARKSGQALIVPIFVDGRGNKLGLNRSLENVLSQPEVAIARLMVVSQFDVDKNRVKDVLSPQHGRPVRYSINDVMVHGSRVIPVYGTQSKTSVFQGLELYFSSWLLGRQDVSRAIQEANFLVLKTDIQNLREIAESKSIVDGQSESVEDLIERRARNLRANANSNNAFVIDKEQEDVVNIQKANIKDMVDAVDQLGQHLAGAADIPISRLLSRQASGLSNSNQGDIQNYIQSLYGYRFMVLEPPIFELDQLLKRIDDEIEIDSQMQWRPLAIEQYLGGIKDKGVDKDKGSGGKDSDKDGDE